MTTFQRDVRPFPSVSAFDGLLAASNLFVGSEAIEPGGRRLLDEDVFLNSRVTLRIGDAEAISHVFAIVMPELERLDVSIDQLEFAVFLTSSYLKISEVRFRVPLRGLADIAPDLVLTSGVRPAALRSPRAGCSIEACVLLAAEQPRKPLKPWRAGSLIARASWELSTQFAFTGFTPRPLTPELKAEMGLSPKAVRYISLDVSPTEDGFGEDSVQVWLDADLMAKMSANPKNKASIALQFQLFLDAVQHVVAEARIAQDFDIVSWAEVKGSVLGKVIGLLIPPNAGEAARDTECDAYLQLLRADAGRFMSHVEEAIGLAAALDAGLDG